VPLLSLVGLPRFGSGSGVGPNLGFLEPFRTGRGPNPEPEGQHAERAQALNVTPSIADLHEIVIKASATDWSGLLLTPIIEAFINAHVT
jgi:hypothetical protein